MAVQGKEHLGNRFDINIELFVDLFQNIYLGTSFAGVVHEDGYKIDQLKREFMQIYQLIKK